MNETIAKLTDKQKAFCEEYLIDLNATQAAIRAGYKEKTAAVTGSENLIKPNVQEYISFLQGKREERTQITQDDVLRDIHLARQIALGEKPHKMVIKDSVGDGMTQHIETEFKKTDLAMFVKLTELQMKHLGMFEKDSESSNKDITIVIE